MTINGLSIVTVSMLGLPRTAPPVGVLRLSATVASYGFPLLLEIGRLNDSWVTPGGKVKVPETG